MASLKNTPQNTKTNLMAYRIVQKSKKGWEEEDYSLMQYLYCRIAS